MISFLAASFASFCARPALLHFVGIWGFLGVVRLLHYIVGGVTHD